MLTQYVFFSGSMSSSEKKKVGPMSWTMKKRLIFQKKLSVPGISQFFLLYPSFIYRPRRLRLRLKPFIHRGKDQHKSCTAHHGEPLLCPCLRTTCNFFFGYFSGLGNVASPSSNEHGSWWASNFRPFD